MRREDLRICVRGFAADLKGVKEMEEEKLNDEIRNFAEVAFNLLVEDIKKHPADATATAIVTEAEFGKIDLIAEALEKDSVKVKEFIEDAVDGIVKNVSIMSMGNKIVAVDVTF